MAGNVLNDWPPGVQPGLHRNAYPGPTEPNCSNTRDDSVEVDDTTLHDIHTILWGVLPSSDATIDAESPVPDELVDCPYPSSSDSLHSLESFPTTPKCNSDELGPTLSYFNHNVHPVADAVKVAKRPTSSRRPSRAPLSVNRTPVRVVEQFSKTIACPERQCVWRSIGFHFARDLLRHMRGVHSKYLSCEHCGVSFRDIAGLNTHQSYLGPCHFDD